MKCPHCGGDTKCKDTRHLPAEDPEVWPTKERGLRPPRSHRRHLDIPARIRTNMPPNSRWRKYKCLDCGARIDTVEFDVSILEPEVADLPPTR